MGDNPFQPSDGTWSAYADLGDLASVLDPRDAGGSKNAYIDALHKQALDAVVTLEADTVVLDYGCGKGRMARHLADRVRRVIGVDITEEMLARAREIPGPSNIVYEHIDGTDLPIPSDSVHLVVSVYVLQYFVKRASLYQHVMSEFARVLRPGGQVVFIEQAASSGGKSISVTEHVAVDDYLAWGEAPFELLSKQMVRRGRPGLIERATVLRSSFPRRLRPFATGLILKRNASLEDGALRTQPYVDYRFHLALSGV